MTELTGTGRSGSGRLRNFKAMANGKLAGVFWEVLAEDDDPEALAALRAEMVARGLDVGLEGLGEEIYDEEDLA